MKLIVVGGVAGGAIAATRARRLDERAEIILLERGEYVSFANCGLPYHISGEIKSRDDLLVATPEKLNRRYNIDVRVMSEAIAVDPAAKTVTVRDMRTQATYVETYDRLILAPGARPIRPPLPGINLDSIFTLRTIPDMDAIMARLNGGPPQAAVVVGGGFIGLEMAESLRQIGLEVTLVEMQDQVMAPLDPEMASFLHNHLREKGVALRLGEAVQSFEKDGGRTMVRTSAGTGVAGDIVLLCLGVTPENELAKKAGLAIGERGGIITNERMQTSDPDIYAVGDAVEVRGLVTEAPAMMPLAGPANKQGRIAAENAVGRHAVFRGVQGTSIVKVFDLTAASTGVSEKTLKEHGLDYRVSYTHSASNAEYYPGATIMAVKLLFTPDDGRVLGAQVVGRDGVDKAVSVLALAIRAGLTVFDLEEFEHAYAPPYSSAKDPVNVAGFVAANLLRGDLEEIQWHEMDDLDPEEHALLDVRTAMETREAAPMFDGAVNIPIDELRSRLGSLDRSKTYVTYCLAGLRGYVAYRMLVQNGFKAVNLSGGNAIVLPVEEDVKARR